MRPSIPGFSVDGDDEGLGSPAGDAPAAAHGTFCRPAASSRFGRHTLKVKMEEALGAIIGPVRPVRAMEAAMFLLTNCNLQKLDRASD